MRRSACIPCVLAGLALALGGAGHRRTSRSRGHRRLREPCPGPGHRGHGRSPDGVLRRSHSAYRAAVSAIWAGPGWRTPSQPRRAAKPRSKSLPQGRGRVLRRPPRAPGRTAPGIRVLGTSAHLRNRLRSAVAAPPALVVAAADNWSVQLNIKPRCEPSTRQSLDNDELSGEGDSGRGCAAGLPHCGGRSICAPSPSHLDMTGGAASAPP